MATPITAMSLYNALGRTTAEVLDALASGRTGLHFRDDDGMLVGRAPEPPHLPEPFAVFEARAARLAAAALTDLVEPVTVARRRWGSQRVALVLGVHAPDLSALPSVVDDATMLHARSSQGPLLLLREALQIRGPSYCVTTEAASGAAAIASAHRLIAAGLADAVVTGGVGSLDPLVTRSFAARRLLSSDPTRPLSAARTGTTLSEGAALLLLERRGDALVDLVSVGEAHDASKADQAPTLAMQSALAAARVEPSAVGFVHMHGLATVTGDFAEASAIKTCFGAHKPVTATCGATGLILGAAGATEAVLTAAALRDGFIPATPEADPADPTLAVSASVQRRELEHDYALVHTAGLGGHSIALLLGVRA